MIDIHPPQHGSMTARDFFIHLGIVVLGILIAIGLEQSVEYFHHRHLAVEARRSLLAERITNESSNQFNIFATQRHERDLQHDLAILHALRAHQPLPPGPFIVRHIRYLYLEDEWHKLHQSGTVNYLTENLGPVDYRYTNQDAFMTHVDRASEDLYRAASVLRTEHDPLNINFEDNLAFSNFTRRLAAAHENLPPQEVDAAWATLAAAANFSTLSPAQIDSLERALQSALADDDALLGYCYNIKRNLSRNPQE
ncbi:MAG TPA: hypothetical protein VFW30_03230 [Bryocella sp.]|nr:hypothetical protein [Bryocella sp.]